MKRKTKKDHVRSSCTSCRHEYNRPVLLPCRPGALLPGCHLLPTFVHRSFYSLLSVPPLPAFPWSGVLPPLFPFLWTPPTANARRCLPRCVVSSRYLTMYSPADSRTPRYHFLAVFAAVDHNAVSAPKPKGESSTHPSVARNSPRSSTMYLCQVFNFQPVLGFPHQPSPRASPTWAIAPCFTVPRRPKRRAALYG